MNDNEFNYEENLASGHLKSSLCKKGIDANLYYYNTDRIRGYEDIFDMKAKIFAFAISETNVNNVYTAIDVLKNKKEDAVVCVFDTFANYNYGDIFMDNDQIDFIPYGNSYNTIAQIYNNICNNKSWKDESISNLLLPDADNSNKKYEKNNFNQYIRADRENLKKRDVIIAHLISSYGCPAHCSFCTMPQVDNSLSFRDVSDVFDEIIQIYNNYNIRFFHFNDATFEGGGTFGKKRIMELCERLARYPIKFGFRCFVRAGSFVKEEDEKILYALKAAGFRNLFVGIESGSNDDLLLYNKRTTVIENEAFLNLCKKVGIKPFFGFVMLNPYSTDKSIKENYNFLVKYRSDQLSHYTNCLQVYSNTPMFERVQRDGLIYENYDYKKNPFQYNCADQDINRLKQFLMKFNFEEKLQKQNSSYHNLIFLRNYLSAVGISDDKVNEKINYMSNELFKVLSDYFGNLYIENDTTYCVNNYEKLVKTFLDIYSDLEPLKKRLLKVYYKVSLNGVKNEQLSKTV